MRIGIIGAGRVGVTMGKYLGDAGVEVSGFYSKTTQSAVQAAEFTDTTVYKSLQDIVEASDTLMITTPDGVISEVWDCIAGYELQVKFCATVVALCHLMYFLESSRPELLVVRFIRCTRSAIDLLPIKIFQLLIWWQRECRQHMNHWHRCFVN